MLELLKKFEEKNPEIVFEWSDSQTDAKGWVVINSLRGGAAGGGTRMRKGLDKHEVTSLAKTMEIKFAVAGPEIGGAKSGINFDPADPRKEGVLKRWYAAVKPILKSYYGTGGDLNVDEIKEVIPMTLALGIEHPQEGVFVGHFKPNEKDKSLVINQLQTGVSKVLTDKNYAPAGHWVVANMITGWGVAEAVKHYYQLWKSSNLIGKTAIIQGWGNVGAAAAWFLAKEGVKITGIIDREGGLIKEEGFSFEEVTDLFLKKEGNLLIADNMIPYQEVHQLIWKMGADIFIPAAASRLVTQKHLEEMNGKVEVISCGANVPFADQEIFYGKTAAYADENFAVIPDFIANCGMARTFAYLMQPGISLEDKDIFEDASKIIYNAMEKLHSLNSTPTKLIHTGYEMVLNKVMNQV